MERSAPLTLNVRSATWSPMIKSGWLQCESVVRGMFSDELAVVVARSNGAEESYFVPAEDVDRERGRVRVGLRALQGVRGRETDSARASAH